MPTLTLAEFKLRTESKLVAGIADDITTTNLVYNVMPFTSFPGAGIIVNREKTIGNAQFLAIGGTITAKAPSAVERITFEPTTVLGDAEINDLQVAMSGSDVNSVVTNEVSSKAKAVGRLVQQGIASGTGTDPQMNSLHSMIDSEQYVAAGGVGGAVIGYAMLDSLLDLVKAKDGQVDFIMMPGAILRQYRALNRTLSNVDQAVIQVGNQERRVDAFSGVPIFQNDWLSTAETAAGAALTGGALASVYAGVWDDGTKKIGCSMIYPEASEMGISVELIGAMETKDERIYRVKQYTNFAIFNRRGVARLTDVALA